MKIVIGTANFLRKYTYKNESVSLGEIIKILNFAKLNKIISIDTAFEYDNFYIVRDSIDLNQFLISTKINFTKKKLIKNNFRQKYINEVKKKLELFKIKSFENLFIHNFDRLSEYQIKVIEPLLLNLKEKGLIRNIAISVYDTSALKKIKNLNFLDLIQAPINLFDRRFTKKKIINFIKRKKIKIQARSIFLQGKLLDNSKRAPYKTYKIFQDYDLWLNKKNRQSIKTCIDYIRSLSYLDSMVVGVNNVKQLREIIRLTNNKQKIIFPRNIFTFNKKIIDPRKW